MTELLVFAVVLLCIFVGMGKECSDCGAEMNVFGQLRGAGGVHTDDCAYGQDYQK